MNTELFELIRDTVKEKGVVEIIDKNMIDLYRRQYDMSAVFEQIRNAELAQYTFGQNNIGERMFSKRESRDIRRCHWYRLKYDGLLPYVKMIKYDKSGTFGKKQRKQTICPNMEEHKIKSSTTNTEPLQYGRTMTGLFQ